VIEVGSLFQLDMCSKYADVFGLRNLDTKRLVRLVTVNETIEAEKLRVGRFRGHSKTNRFRGDTLTFWIFVNSILGVWFLVRLVTVDEAVGKLGEVRFGGQLRE